MGQSTSVQGTYKLKRPSFKEITLGTMGKRRLNNSKNLSHTFSFPDETFKPQQLNINTATEEELMTLPGISRNIASNIVTHRRLIGRFNRIEDVALVSGVGAHKLENIKLEIYVASVNHSGTSSRASTNLDSTDNNDHPIDVNLASIFDLQTVPGIDQKLASKIVEKRIKHGCYHSLDELAKLPGMGKHRLTIIRPHLQINITNGSIFEAHNNKRNSLNFNVPQASSTPRLNNNERKSFRTYRNQQKYTAIARVDNCEHLEVNRGITEDEIWELLSIASPRPNIAFDYVHHPSDINSIRVASWNLSDFNTDKASNPGVMEVICRTILEYRLSLLALQEVKTFEALDKITSELNSPSLKRVRDWRENQREWHSMHLGAGLAVLWDGNSKNNIILKQQPPATTVFLPVLASMIFQFNNVDLTIINVQMHDPDDNKIIDRFMDTKNSIFLGDFSLIHDSSNGGAMDIMNDINTAVNPNKYLFKDKIIWKKNSRGSSDTALYRVVRQGLTHLGIPQGWRWGGPASDHCPVWCEIFIESNDT